MNIERAFSRQYLKAKSVHFSKLLFISLIFVCVVDPFGEANAYLDPGTGSMLLQLILGGVAGVVVVAKLYWQKMKSFFSREKSH